MMKERVAPVSQCATYHRIPRKPLPISKLTIQKSPSGVKQDVSAVAKSGVAVTPGKLWKEMRRYMVSITKVI